MIVGLDTSVLVRLLSGDPRDLAIEALRFLLERQEAGDRLDVSNLALAETYYALQHHYGASKQEALAALRDLLATPGIHCDPGVVELLATPGLEAANPGFVDRLIHGDYLLSGAEQLATFEKAAGKLPGVVVLSASR